MKVEVRPLNVAGRPLRGAALKTQAPAKGRLRVFEDRLRDKNRWVRCAALVSVTSGTEHRLLPDLEDVQLLWADDGRMRLKGIEEVDGIRTDQTWEVRVV